MHRRKGNKPRSSGTMAVWFLLVILFVGAVDLFPLLFHKDVSSSTSSVNLENFQSQNEAQGKTPAQTPIGIPEWMQAHVRFQNQWVQSESGLSDSTDFTLRQSNRKRPPLLVWNCPTRGSCGGLGDRLYGIIMGLFIAMLTQRIFLVQEWKIKDVAHPLWDYVQPSHLHYRVALPPRDSSDFGVLSLVDNRQHPVLLEPCELQPDKRDYFLRNNLMTYEPQLTNSACLKDYWKASSVTHINDNHSLAFIGFHTLFRFTQRAHQKSRLLLQEAKILAPSDAILPQYIGMHVRTGQGTTWHDPERHTGTANLERFGKCALQLQRAVAAKCGTNPSIYVAADNHEVKEFLLNNYGKEGSLKFVTDKEILHIDRSKLDLIDNVRDAYDFLWTELKVLVDATCLVMSRSKISTLATDLNPQYPRCAVYFDECSDEQVQQAARSLPC